MALTRDFKQTVVERVARDQEFSKALLDEAATLFLSERMSFREFEGRVIQPSAR